MYKFNKLPYRYEPGVTRSLYHGHRIKACIQEPMKQADPTAPQKTQTSTSPSAFTPVSPLHKKSWSWPLLPTPPHPIVWYPGSSPNTPTIFDTSKTMVVFPFAVGHPVTSYPLLFAVKQEVDEPVGHVVAPEIASIPVSAKKA